MTIFILALSLLIAIIAIVVLMGISPASQKAKVWTMYAGAALMFIAAPAVCGYIDDAVGTLAKSRFYGLLFFTIAVGYLCVAIGCMEKYNVLKRRTRILEEALTEKEQEKVSALLEHQSEKLQAIQTKEIEWLTGKIKMFTDDEQKAILASVLHFAQHNLILPPSISIQPNEACSQQELMYYVCSAFFNVGKKRSDIASFLYKVFPLYFPAGESALTKKMPGQEKVRERRENEL